MSTSTARRSRMTASTSSVRLAEPEDHPRLGGDVGGEALGEREDLHHALVAAAGAAALVEARDGLGVVVVDVGARLEHGADGGLVPLEVGDEHLDRAGGNARADLPDRLGEDERAEVGEVVAVHGGDDGVLQLISAIAAATRAGSSMSYLGGRPWATAQYAQFRVQTSPRIMNVAVPCSQHSPTFGQCASSQTVWSSRSRMRWRRRE